MCFNIGLVKLTFKIQFTLFFCIITYSHISVYFRKPVLRFFERRTLLFRQRLSENINLKLYIVFIHWNQTIYYNVISFSDKSVQKCSITKQKSICKTSTFVSFFTSSAIFPQFPLSALPYNQFPALLLHRLMSTAGNFSPSSQADQLQAIHEKLLAKTQNKLNLPKHKYLSYLT